MRLHTLIAINLLAYALMFSSCTQGDSTKQNFKGSTNPAKPLSENFKSYWYSGIAELSSYKLEQARYGEIRDGHAVLIFVTEDFKPTEQVKADRAYPDNVSVLKLNSTKKFNTGIYPYSVMQSTFYPVDNNHHALKVSCSMQEWCGHVYSQLNNREKFEVMSHSYFEGEADQEYDLEKTALENELWTQLRIDPLSLPQGTFECIPSLEFIRYRHIEIKPYKAEATLENGRYVLAYPSLNRTLTILFNPEFPFEVKGWEDSYPDGYGEGAQRLTTKATRLKQIRTAYWQQNSNADEVLRDSLMIR